MRRFVLCAIAVALACVSPQAQTPPKPNILFIQADDLGYGDLERVRPGDVSDPPIWIVSRVADSASSAITPAAPCAHPRGRL